MTTSSHSYYSTLTRRRSHSSFQWLSLSRREVTSSFNMHRRRVFVSVTHICLLCSKLIAGKEVEDGDGRGGHYGGEWAGEQCLIPAMGQIFALDSTCLLPPCGNSKWELCPAPGTQTFCFQPQKTVQNFYLKASAHRLLHHTEAICDFPIWYVKKTTTEGLWVLKYDF